jgi:hypothetical protein
MSVTLHHPMQLPMQQACLPYDTASLTRDYHCSPYFVLYLATELKLTSQHSYIPIFLHKQLYISLCCHNLVQ